MQGWIDQAKALLWCWYPGQNGAVAVAEALLGEINPSGKLPFTAAKRLEDRSCATCYHDEDGDKRVRMADGVFGGYRHFDRHGVAPRFAFGFGLSYTRFEYANLQLSSSEMRGDEPLGLTFELTNAGDRAGAEVVQLYIRDVESRLPRPEKELKGFVKVRLEPGETRTVEMEIPRRALEYYDPDTRAWVAEDGEFEALIAASAADIRLRAGFTFSDR